MNALLSLDEIIFEAEPHTYTIRNKVYQSVTQTIGLAGLGEDFSMVNPERLERARRRGDMVHLACQYYAEGLLDIETVHESIRGFVQGYIKFRKKRPMKVLALEKRMAIAWKEHGEDLYLAGTPDLVCFMDGVRCVIDLKTSQGMTRGMGLQTAGYKILWNMLYPKAPIKERFGLKLTKTGDFKLIPHIDPDDETAFKDLWRHAASVQRIDPWLKKYSKGGKYELGYLNSPA